MKKILVCTGGKCRKKNENLLQELENFLDKNNIKDIKIETSACVKKCSFGPNVILQKNFEKIIKLGTKKEDFEKYINYLNKGKSAKSSINDLLNNF